MAEMEITRHEDSKNDTTRRRRWHLGYKILRVGLIPASYGPTAPVRSTVSFLHPSNSPIDLPPRIISSLLAGALLGRRERYASCVVCKSSHRRGLGTPTTFPVEASR